MKIPHLIFIVLFTFTGLMSCDLSSPKNVDEVGEEAAEFVDEIGPDRESSGEVPVPTPLTTPEETMYAAENAGGLLKLSPEAAIGSIEKWIGTLQTHPDVDDSDDLVNDLMQLKVLLQQSPIDGEKVSEVLEDLADETEEAADDADNKMVSALAKALETAAEQLD